MMGDLQCKAIINSTLFAELWVAVKTAGLLVLVVVAAAHVQAGPWAVR